MRARSFLKYIRHPSFIFRKESPEHEEVQKFVKKIYSPDSFMMKPRFRKKLDGHEERRIMVALKKVYNPRV